MTAVINQLRIDPRTQITFNDSAKPQPPQSMLLLLLLLLLVAVNCSYVLNIPKFFDLLAVSNAPKAIFCSECGTKNDQGKFCGNCGHTLAF
jgi:hypothetical protein